MKYRQLKAYLTKQWFKCTKFSFLNENEVGFSRCICGYDLTTSKMDRNMNTFSKRYLTSRDKPLA